jgi:hypothetical protein
MTIFFCLTTRLSLSVVSGLICRDYTILLHVPMLMWYSITELNSVALVRERTIPTERLPEINPDTFVGTPLWSSGQSSWLQIQRSGFDSRRYHFFWEIVGLEWGPFNLMSITEELHERNSSGSGLEIREYGRRDPSRWPRGTFYPQKLSLTSPTSGGRSVGVIRSRTQATEFFVRLILF